MEHFNLSAYYARTSTEEQKEKQTIQSQVSALEAEIAKQGAVLTGKYIDDGTSGAVLERPALDRLRADAKRKLFQKLYIYSPDRLARELMLQLIVVKELRRQSVEVIFLSQKFSDSPGDRLLFQMLGAISEFERAQILERTRRGKLHKARAGILIGSIPKFGYTYVKKTDTAPGRYEVNPDEADTVQEIFRLFNSAQVSGIRTLAKELYKLGLKNRSGTTKWAKSSLSKILTDSTYIGVTYFNKYMACEPLKECSKPRYKTNASRRLRPKEEWIPIKVPSIITTEEFESAQQRFARNRELSDRNAKHNYLLKGLAFCGCGKRMYGYPCHGKARYKCSDKHTRYPLPKTCLKPSVDAAVLEGAIWKAFLEVLDRPEVVTAKVNEMHADTSRAQIEFEQRKNHVEKELTALADQEERLLKAYAESVINLAQLKSRMDALATKRTELTKEVARLASNSTTSRPPLRQEDVDAYFRVIKQQARAAPFALRQQIVRLLAERVILDDRSVIIKAFLPNPVPTESTTLHRCGRNEDFGLTLSINRDHPDDVSMEVTTFPMPSGRYSGGD